LYPSVENFKNEVGKVQKNSVIFNNINRFKINKTKYYICSAKKVIL